MSAGLDNGEVAMTADTGRVFIGHIPAPGDVNYRRAAFPYQNIEVLTEASPRIRELISEFTRDQGTDSFYLPLQIQSDGSYAVPTGYSDPTEIPNECSATFEYHAFDGNGNPMQQGVVRAATGLGVSATEKIGSGVTFTLTPNGSVTNLTILPNQTCIIYLRRTIINSV
jgi:hypothetical protein